MTRAWIALAVFPVAAAAMDPATVADSVGVPAGTRVDVAIFSRDGTCLSAQYPREVGGERPRYHVASISKLFTATVILQLRDEGALALNDPVGKFVPEFAGSPIHLEHLLTHTSGLRDRERARGRTSRMQWDDYIRKLASQRLANEPGAKWAYADAGFNLLGRVIENLTRKDYLAALRERLLDPLGMSMSSFDLSNVPEGLRVVATSARGRPLGHPWDVAFLPSSGLQSDARDLARFGSEMLAVAAGTSRLFSLRGESLREMTETRLATEWSGVSQGYGWQLHGSGREMAWRHAGGEAGFETLLVLYPEEGFGIVALGNRKDWPRFEFVSALAAEVRAKPTICGAHADSI